MSSSPYSPDSVGGSRSIEVYILRGNSRDKRWKMGRAAFILALLYVSIWAAGQTTSENPPQAKVDHSSGKAKDEITVRGCVSKLSTDYVLVQADPGNTYELQGSRKLRLSRYLGQEVEVAGPESPSMSTSSDFLARAGSASPVTITVHSIKSIAKRCSAY